MALKLPESMSQDDRLALKALTVELWNIFNSLALFDIVSIDQQYQRVTNLLTTIARLEKAHVGRSIHWGQRGSYPAGKLRVF